MGAAVLSLLCYRYGVTAGVLPLRCHRLRVTGAG